MKEIWVSSGNWYLVQNLLPILQEAYPDATVFQCYRDYHFEHAAKTRAKPILVVTDGTSKTRDSLGQSEGIWHEDARRYARDNGIPVVDPLAFGRYSPHSFRLQLKTSYPATA